MNAGDFKFRFAYQASVWEYKYGRQETRPANIRNPNGYGALCKHLTAVLSNKKWLQQVTGTVMDWCVKNIDKINEYLKLDKEYTVLTLPNELARQNAKKAFYTKLFDKDDNNEETTNNEEDLEDVDKDINNDTEDTNNNSNINNNQNSVNNSEEDLTDIDEEN